MSKDWIESTDEGLSTQSSDISAKITAAPASFSLTASDATSLASDVSAYQAALNAWLDPATATPVTRETKDVTKAALKARLRSFGRRIQASPTVSSSAKVSIGLRVRDQNPTRAAAPATRPVINVKSVVERTLNLLLTDELTPTKRAKPQGADVAEIFVFVGDSAPAELTAWTYFGQASRASFALTLPASVASGAKVWIAARWTNATGMPGPRSTPVAALVTGSIAEAA